MDFILTSDDSMWVRYDQMKAMANEARKDTQQCQAAVANQSTCIKIGMGVLEAAGKPVYMLLYDFVIWDIAHYWFEVQ
jgi:hypothetical protein